MTSQYSKHYAEMNGIDLNSDKSIKDWLLEVNRFYDKELSSKMGDLRHKSVLDIGCGFGGMLYYLKQSGCKKYLGVDSSGEQLEICEKYVTDRIKKADVSNFLAQSVEKYDIIIMYDLIEHIKKEEVGKLLQLVYNNLSDKGMLIIRTPNMGALFAGRMRYIDITHETGYTYESLKQLLNQFPFVKTDFYNSYITGKRLFLFKLVYSFLNFIFNEKPPKILTDNIISVAHK